MDVTDNKSVSTHRMSTKKPYQRIQSTSYHRQSTSRLVYKGVLGTIAAKVSSESEENLEAEHSTKAYTREERSWFIIPSFFSRCVQIQYSSAFGSAERVLRTYPIIRDDHPVWKMCSQNDTIGLQQLFSDREISPYSVDSHGATLLHDTVHWFNVETSALLLNFGVQPGVEDARGR
ncbi:uncharacterized protein LY89DRAFT_111170 [Mollisia scopiformis]|uniref:Uncharacterized protein n=1 Tax=Mollisia scopiformis TaxID=149040 RepID=A0A194X5L3_MOLSC|nr:uncharacterized protein LY89DRAFT_111170 [Mollisia scopiformis]KUJ15369.1 hypothetical protein LY89DRAFT_111170 [Mollisia scopiformis]